MPKVRRSRLLPVDRSDVWRVVSDPLHLYRWWPKVSRVEGVQERKRGAGTLWTTVLKTNAGKSVRADFRCLYSKEPSAYAWEQEIDGTPFAKVLRSSATTLNLSEQEGGTLLTLESDQGLRGLSRLGGFMLRRATAAQLETALEGLERALCGGGEKKGRAERKGGRDGGGEGEGG